MATQPTPPPGEKPNVSIQTFGGEPPPAAPATPSVAQILRNAKAITENDPKLIIPEIEDMIEELTGTRPMVDYRTINNTKDEIFVIDLPKKALENNTLAQVDLNKEELRNYLVPEEPGNAAGNPDDLELNIEPLVTLAVPAYRMRSALKKFNAPQETTALPQPEAKSVPAPASAPAAAPMEDWEVATFIMEKLIHAWKKAGKISDPVTLDNLAQAICEYAKAKAAKDPKWEGLKNITITHDGKASHVIFHNVAKDTDRTPLFQGLADGVIVHTPQPEAEKKTTPVTPKPEAKAPVAVETAAPVAKPSAHYTREKFVTLLKRTFAPPSYSCAEAGTDFVVNYVGADSPIIKIRARNFLPIFGFSEAHIKQITFSEPGGDIKLQMTIPEAVAQESFDAAAAKAAPIAKKPDASNKSHAAKHAGKPPVGGHGKGH